MANLQVDTKALKEQAKAFVIDKLKTVKDRALQKARERCPVDKGQLQMSLIGDIEITEESVSIWIGSHLPYAKYVEYCRFPGWFHCDAKNPHLTWKTKQRKIMGRMFGKETKVNPRATIPFLRPSLFEAIDEMK
ncbi:MAG: HK97 gp10 family phage protein [Candidatus Hodarchaeales archaeon]